MLKINHKIMYLTVFKLFHGDTLNSHSVEHVRTEPDIVYVSMIDLMI